MCANMCVDTCVDECVSVSADLCADLCVGICADMCVDMCVDMRIGMCMGMYIGGRVWFPHRRLSARCCFSAHWHVSRCVCRCGTLVEAWVPRCACMFLLTGGMSNVNRSMHERVHSYVDQFTDVFMGMCMDMHTGSSWSAADKSCQLCPPGFYSGTILPYRLQRYNTAVPSTAV